MENFIIYIAKASGLMAMFILAYYAFLRKETFFNTNRWYLLTGLLTSALLPLVEYTKVVWVEPHPLQQLQQIDLNRLVMMQQLQESTEMGFTINWLDIAAGMYILGVIFFLTRFVIDILTLRKLIKGQPVVKEDGFLLVDSPKIKSPFSFFNYIVFNSATLKPEELNNILTHEKVHSGQKHSLDMIIGHLYCAVFWFNPFAWMYKKSIAQNLEFIADAEATKQIEDKKAYQKTLLKITVHPECIAITNHFYQSLIKKRIVMLNRQQSKKRNSWKYVLVLPALVAFMLAFQVKTVAQQKEAPAQLQMKSQVALVVEITKDMKEEDFKDYKKIFKQEFDADANFENIKRNPNKEITAIKVTVEAQGQSQMYEVAGKSPIQPFTIEIEKDDTGRNSINFGTAKGGHQIMARTFKINSDSDSIVLNGKGTIKVRPLDESTIPMAPPAPRMQLSNGVKFGNDDVLVVIDGVIKGKGEAAMKGLRSGEIASINVLKNKEAKKKYGKEAKNGVIEITTKKTGRVPRVMHLEPRRHFEFSIPDLPNIPDMPNMEHFEFRFGDMGDMEELFKDNNGDVKMYRRHLSTEEMAELQEKMQKMQEEMLKNYKEMDFSTLWDGFELRKELKEKNKEEGRKEIEEARKELEKARKEVEEARKELERTRQQFNKKT